MYLCISAIQGKIIESCKERYNLDESVEKELRETLYLPHVHVYQREFETQLDVGEKEKLKMSKSPKNKLEDTENKQNCNIDLYI